MTSPPETIPSYDRRARHTNSNHIPDGTFDQEHVPDWPEGTPRNDKSLYQEQYGWEIEGRKLCAIHWGVGIGSNAWNDADVVFLFDEFFIPQRQIVATVQGLLNHKATEGVLATLKVLNETSAPIECLWEGHSLSWTKQLALRGKGRTFDEQGVCLPQKVVCSMDRMRLLTNFHRLFPRAKLEIVPASKDAKQTYADRVVDILSRSGLPDVVSTRDISRELGTEWRVVGKHLKHNTAAQQAFEALGWSYVDRKGRPGAYFMRRRPEIIDTETETEAMTVEGVAVAA